MGKVNVLGALAAIFALLWLILSALGLIGAEQKIVPGNTEIRRSSLPANLKTMQVAKQRADNQQSWPGTVQSRTVTKIAPKITARIVTIAVNNGDKVKKGTVIAQLDQRQIHASLNEAEAALNAAKATAAQAQREAQRSQTLYAHEATTRATHEATLAQAQITQAAVAQAANNVEQIRVGLGDATLQAPFDGMIAERLKEPGDMGMPGDPLVTLLKPDDLRLEAAIPSECAKRFKLGLSVQVRIDALALTLAATVDEIVPQVDRQTGTQLLKASLPLTAGLQPGQFAWLDLSCTDQQSALFIPLSAVLQYGQLEAVKVVSDQQIYTRHIRTGKQQGEQVEVLSGLREGETIVVNSTTPVAAGIEGQ
jgi:RND family efflux transporter MFP subunit